MRERKNDKDCEKFDVVGLVRPSRGGHDIKDDSIF